MSIQRYCAGLISYSEGEYVLFAEHEAALLAAQTRVRELETEYLSVASAHGEMSQALNISEAKRKELYVALQAICSTLTPDHTHMDKARAALGEK